MSQDRFDEWLKEAADQNIPLAELEGDWLQLQDRLQKEKRRRRGFIWWWTFAGLLLILVVSIGSIFLFGDPSTDDIEKEQNFLKEELAEANWNNEETAIRKDEKIDFPIDEKLPEDSSDAEIGNSNMDNFSATSNATKPELMASVEKPVVVKKNVEHKSFQSGSNFEKDVSTGMHEEQAVFLDQGTSPDTPFPNGKSGDVDLNIWETKYLGIPSLKSLHMPSHFPVELEFSNMTLLLDGKDDAIVENALESDPSWFIGLDLAAGALESSFNSRMVDDFSTFEKGQQAIAVEGKAWRRLRAGWRLGAGLGLQYGTIRAQQKMDVVKRDVQEEGIAQIIQRADGQFDTITGWINGTGMYEIDRTNYHQYWSISVPFGLGYDWKIGKRNRLSGEIVVLPEYFVYRTGQGVASPSTPLDLVSIEERYSNAISWSLSPRLSYGYQVNDHTSFHLGLRYDWGRNGQALNDGQEHQLSRFMMTAGLHLNI